MIIDLLARSPFLVSLYVLFASRLYPITQEDDGMIAGVLIIGFLIPAILITLMLSGAYALL